MTNDLEKLIGLVRDTTNFTAEECRELQVILEKIEPKNIPDDFIVELKDIIDMMFHTNNVFFENKDKIDAFYKALVLKENA